VSRKMKKEENEVFWAEGFMLYENPALKANVHRCRVRVRSGILHTAFRVSVTVATTLTRHPQVSVYGIYGIINVRNVVWTGLGAGGSGNPNYAWHESINRAS